MGIDYVEDRTRDHFSGRWIKNAVINGRKTYTEDLGKIVTYVNSKRVIVCGTGPSLNDDFARLRAIQQLESKNETLIIGNHSNLPALLYEGVIPQIVIIADSGDPTFLRLKRDVLPHFKSELRKAHTVFILPTHCHPGLYTLINEYRLPIYTFLSLMRALEGDAFAKLYNDTLFAAIDPEEKFGDFTCILQAGSVSNASVLVCHALHMLGKIPQVSEIYLTGVDYSYPDRITRCKHVTWNVESRQFDVDEKPTFIGDDIHMVKYNGLLTSEDQVAYYKDLRFIYWNMIQTHKPEERPFEIFTSNNNFVADFIPIKSL